MNNKERKAAPMKRIRTVYYGHYENTYRLFPMIRIQGIYLLDYGFQIGDLIEVHFAQNKITINKLKPIEQPVTEANLPIKGSDHNGLVRYAVEIGNTCFGVEVKNGIVTTAAPIGRWTIGRKWKVVRRYLLRKGASVTKTFQEEKKAAIEAL